MKMDSQKVLGIAALARLEISQDQARVLAVQMDDILGYMDKLNELDTTSVEPMYTPVEHVSVLRADVVRSELSREEILRNAPENNGEYFVVPRIV
jgi:aspartyl-tRNA(Asn)/glutamyl-tRNA(Gln) amidotransferase subunit C